MWGSDYPHREASYPFSREALRLTFAGVDPVEVQQMVGGNAARPLRVRPGQPRPVGATVGPTHAEIARPLAADEIPDGADPLSRPSPV